MLWHVLTVPIGSVCHSAGLSGPLVRCALPALHSPLLSAAVCNALWAIHNRHDRHTCKCKWRLRIEPKLYCNSGVRNTTTLCDDKLRFSSSHMHSCLMSLKHLRMHPMLPMRDAAIEVSVLHVLKDHSSGYMRNRLGWTHLSAMGFVR
jgi:hypothetical protein